MSQIKSVGKVAMEHEKVDSNHGTSPELSSPQDAISQISKLNDIFNLLGTDSKTNIDIIVKHACELLEGVCCLYNRLDRSHESLIAWAHHNLPDDFNCEDTPDGHICYEATIKGGSNPVIIGDISKTIYQDSDVNVRKYKLKSYLGYPVLIGGESIGALCIVDTKKRDFSSTEVHIISTLAKALSIEEERKRAEEEIQKLQTLKSVGTLAGGIAHDFNNILMGLFGNITMAKLKLEQDHPAYSFLEKAEQSMERATNLTTQLLTFAKGGVPVKEHHEIDKLLHEVVRFDLSGSNVTPIFDLMDHLWIVEIDKGQIQQVFSNLTINALNAMPSGGTLKVSAQNISLAEGVIVSLQAGRYVKIIFRDSGIGIDKKHLQLIFDPYFTTSQAGCGLGLATVFSIMTKHNGHIHVESELGRGTIFSLYFPASESQIKEQSKQPGARKLTPQKAGKILVMDDDEMNLEVASAMLKECGYSVVLTTDGEKTIELYKQSLISNEPIRAMILDLTIPGGLGGKETIKEILKLDPHATAIVSSGYSDDPVLATYADYGFKGVAAKPYDMKTLQRVLNKVLNEQPL